MRLSSPSRVIPAALVLLSGMIARPVSAEAQAPEAAALPTPAAPAPTAPAGAPADAVLDRLRQMEERLDAVSRQNEQLSRENQRLAEQFERLSRREKSPNLGGTASGGAAADGPSGADAFARLGDPPGRVAGSDRASRAGTDESHASGGGSKSSGGDPTSSGRAQVVGNRKLGKIPLTTYYDFDNDGFRLATRDDEFELRIRAMTQVDARIYEQPNQDPVSGGVYNPRTRIYFEGRLSKPISYEISFQNTFDTFNLLDAYLNFAYDERLQFEIGRFKNPHLYEWYRVHIWHLLSPERSLFATNFEANRRFGAMFHGSLFQSRMEYAVGSFNGARNSYAEFNNSQDVTAFVNFKPFVNWEDSPVRDFQFGGSVDAGYQNNPLTPAALRTSSAPSSSTVDSSSAGNIANVPFLAFNPTVRERGERALWELHAAYYYKGLSLLAAWDSGYQNYALGESGPPPIKVATEGWFVQAGYLLTGETLRDRTLIEPINPFDLRKGHFGLGAFEVTARYSELNLGKQVFTRELADPNLWTRRAEMTDLGFNWYLNRFVKVYFDWEHAMFASPVRYRPDASQKTSDLFWLRFQVYF